MLRHLLLAAAAASAASAVALGGDGDDPTTLLVGDHPCTYGPSYWCRGIKESAECGATRHCIERHWRHLGATLQEDNDEVCDICIRMVGEARDQLRSNETLVRVCFNFLCKLTRVMGYRPL